MGRAFILNNLYVLSEYLRRDSQFPNDYNNLGITAKILVKYNNKYFYLDNGMETKLFNLVSSYENDRGEKVALTPLANDDANTYNYKLPFVGNLPLDMKVEVIGGKRYVKREEVRRFCLDYNLKLNQAYKDDVKYFKRILKEQEKARKSKR